MPLSQVPVPTSWPTIKATYEAITNKLFMTATKQQKIDAINYWIARLNEDKTLVNAGSTPSTVTYP